MSVLRISLFGKFQVQCDQRTATALGVRKAQHMFCYLLLHPDRPHLRETLADLLWGGNSTTQSKGYLRKALWQLQATLDSRVGPLGYRVLLVEPDWVQLNPEADLWLDVAVFGQAFSSIEGVAGKELDGGCVQTLQNAVSLYQGDLLEGWYQDWCLYERERLKHMHLIMLDKLMGYYEAQHDWESSLAYGTIILRHDRARERTHRWLMRLHHLARDRTAALRQYERCVAALDEELGVRPSQRTQALYQQIRADQLDEPTLAPTEAHAAPKTAASLLPTVLDRLKRLQAVLNDVQHQVQQGIQAVERALND